MPHPALPSIRSVKIVAAQPEPADLRRIAALAAQGNAGAQDDAGAPVVHLVKIYLSKPLPVTSQGFALYVGDEWVRKYFEFPGGLYFSLPDAEFLQRHQSHPIRFTLDHRTFIETGTQLPRADLAQVRRDSMAAAARADLAAEASPRLPTKKEALRE